MDGVWGCLLLLQVVGDGGKSSRGLRIQMLEACTTLAISRALAFESCCKRCVRLPARLAAVAHAFQTAAIESWPKRAPAASPEPAAIHAGRQALPDSQYLNSETPQKQAWPTRSKLYD